MNATTSRTFAVSLTEEERAELLRLVEQSLRDARVEEHRTDSLNYRQLVENREAILESLAGKLCLPT